MSHKEVLTQLFPLELGGDHVLDQEVEARALDVAHETAQQLLQEMLGCRSFALLERWEKTYALPVSPDDTLQIRRGRVLQKQREIGGLDIAYFIQQAAGLGFNILIQELQPLMAGWMEAGDEVMGINEDGTSNADWCWRVRVTSEPGFLFRAGESCAGEPLGVSYRAVLEAVINDLKPGDTYVDFVYL